MTHGRCKASRAQKIYWFMCGLPYGVTDLARFVDVFCASLRGRSAVCDGSQPYEEQFSVGGFYYEIELVLSQCGPSM